MPSLVEKYTDSKILVRTANVKMLKKLMSVCSPAAVLELLAHSGLAHASWRVREEVVNTAIMVRDTDCSGGGWGWKRRRGSADRRLSAECVPHWQPHGQTQVWLPANLGTRAQAALQHARDPPDHAAVFRLLASALSDPKERVRAVALEGMAALAAALGGGGAQALLPLLHGADAARLLSDAQRQQVSQRVQRGGPGPTCSPEGMVQHAVLDSLSDSYDAGSGGGSGGGAPPDLVPGSSSGGGAARTLLSGVFQHPQLSGAASRLPWEASVPRPRPRQALDPWGGSTPSQAGIAGSHQHEAHAPHHDHASPGHMGVGSSSGPGAGAAAPPPPLMSVAGGGVPMPHGHLIAPIRTHAGAGAGAAHGIAALGGVGGGGGAGGVLPSRRSYVDASGAGGGGSGGGAGYGDWPSSSAAGGGGGEHSGSSAGRPMNAFGQSRAMLGGGGVGGGALKHHLASPGYYDVGGGGGGGMVEADGGAAGGQQQHSGSSTPTAGALAALKQLRSEASSELPPPSSFSAALAFLSFLPSGPAPSSA